jgi:DNA-binding transcriptional MerR regulator
MDEHLSPSDVARASGLSTDTLRHYERKGVLPAPRRLMNGYRRYPKETMARVRLIQRALAVGFTLDELASILRERDRGGAPCKKVHQLASSKLLELERRLEEMMALRDELRGMLLNWEGKLKGAQPGKQARLLDSLAETELTPSNGRQRGAGLGWRERKSKRS